MRHGKWPLMVLAILLISTLAQASPSSPLDKSSLAVAEALRGDWSIKISANPRSGDAPLTVNFLAEISGPTWGGSHYVSWDFGDGGEGTGSVATHTFQNPGKFSVVCSLINKDTHHAAAFSSIEIKVVRPNLRAEIAAEPSSGTAPLEVQFHSTIEGGLEPYGYAWDFGDGQNSDYPHPSHLYSNPGKYTVILMVRDKSGDGGQDVASAAIEVEKTRASLLTASFSANQTSGDAPLSVSFISSISGGVPPFEYYWDFGTGDSSADPNPSYIFQTPGSKHVSLIVNDADSPASQARYDLEISVAERLPSEELNASDFRAVISGSSAKGGTPLTVQFNSSIQGGSPDYTFLWGFGDGETSSDANPSHTFTEPGQYYVHLQVTDSSSSMVASNTLMISVESFSGMAGSTGDGGNPAGALLALSLFGVLALVTILMQVFRKKRKTVKGKRT